ncbi:hypothetical protein [Roseibium aestuarii]|uniref:Uncharacterized protein n=1 Tax=Roseibium aestuarii TaxID=2600299 RepID=A0ABW4JUG2_9HYPH|nr:hypothetical protein [Roseibium aestuarii]
MPYDLKSYETGVLITSSNTAPQAQPGLDTFAQAGWNPVAQGNVVTNGVYRLDGPDNVKRKIKVLAVGAGLNAITYQWEGLA